MKNTILLTGSVIVLFTMLFMFTNQLKAQSNESASIGAENYDYAYTMTDEELEAMKADRVFERGYSYKKKASVKSIKKDGSYGIIIESSYTNELGKLITIHSTASGCLSLDDAKKAALADLKKNNPKWVNTNSYVVVAKFENK